MSVKISELPILDSLADNDIVAGVDVSGNVTSKIEMGTLKNYIDTNTQYTAGTNIDITNNVVSAPNVYNKDEMDSQIEELQSEVDSLSMIYNAFPTESGEGESLTLNDTAEVKFKKFDLKGNTSQDGTPTPSSPIPINVVSGDNEIVECGKNLFDNVVYKENYSITSSGGESYNSNFNLYKMNIKANTNYDITIKNTDSLARSCRICAFKSDDTFISEITSYNILSSETKSVTFKTPNETGYIKFHLAKLHEYTQLELGTSPSEYEPYQGNTYNIDLPVENKLAFPYIETTKSLYGIDYTVYSDGTIKVNGTATNNSTFTIANQTSTGLRKLLLNNDCYFSGCPSSGSSSTYTLQLYGYGSTGAGVLRDVGDGVDLSQFANENNNFNIAIYISTGTTINNLVFKPMLEIGSKANSYTPYGTTPIELCKIGNYQDYFYKDSGKWYLHKVIEKVISNGTESWSIGNSGTNKWYYYRNLGSSKSRATDGEGKSNYYQFNEITSSNTSEGIFVSSNGYLRIRYGTEDTIENYKTWLVTHNVILYYVLATPTNTEITYQPLIDQLNELEKAISYEGQTNISQVNNDLPFIVSIEAILSLKNVLDRVTLLES